MNIWQPIPGTPAHNAYLAGRKACEDGKPLESPYKRLVNSQTVGLSSWWEAGWQERNTQMYPKGRPNTSA